MRDTLVEVQGQRRPFSSVHMVTSPGYAGGQTWYISTDSLRFNNRAYVKYGVARVITPAELTRSGEVLGVPVFTSAQSPDVIFVPTRPGCEFQGYNPRAAIQVRG